MPELSTPPRSPSTCVQTVSSICSSNCSAVLVTSTPPAVTVWVAAVPAWPAAWSTSAAGSTCAPWVRARRAEARRPPRPGGGLLDMRCARASHRLTGGATTGGDCWFAWREPTGGPARAPPSGAAAACSGPVGGLGRILGLRLHDLGAGEHPDP